MAAETGQNQLSSDIVKLYTLGSNADVTFVLSDGEIKANVDSCGWHWAHGQSDADQNEGRTKKKKKTLFFPLIVALRSTIVSLVPPQ